MDAPRRPWLEALGLLLVLALAATAFLVSRRPTSPETPGTATAPAPTAPTAAPGERPGQDVVPGGDPIRSRPPLPQGAGAALPSRLLGCALSSFNSLEVATFNMHSGWNRDRSRQELPRIAGELAALDADVVVLQEVDRNRIWSGRVDQAAYLADQLGMTYVFAANVVRPGDSEYGTAVLSRFPIVESGNTSLPRPGGTQQRGLLRAVVRTPTGRSVSVYSTHFEHTSQQARLLQARAAARVIGADPHPAVVGGDMNARPASAPMATLRSVARDSWSVAGRGAGLTHPAGAPRSRIDYLYARGDLGVNAIVTRPSAVSDHRAVLASYDLTPGVADEDC